MEGGEERSLAETPTWSVATVTTVMISICFIVERSIYRFGKLLKRKKLKALLASLDKIREELMLLGIISLMLTQTEGLISSICVPSSLFSSRFYICSEKDLKNGTTEAGTRQLLINTHNHNCGEGREPFVSLEGLEQLNRFLFTLGITHVLYSGVTVVLAMLKIYSWRKWENQVCPISSADLQLQETPQVVVKKRKNMGRQSTFVFQNASHPWSRDKILIWMNHKLHVSYNFHSYMVRSMEDEFHGSVGISWPLWVYAILCIFVNIHGLNIYFWLSFIPIIMVILVGTKLRHVVAQLALDASCSTGPLIGSHLRPRDALFWFRKPEIMLWLIQFISFQNAFEMATFIWSLSELNAPSCFMKNHVLISIRLVSGIVVQFWCSYCTLPLNVIVSQMGSKFKKSLISENVRDSLHSWCNRIKKKRSRHDQHHSLHSNLTTTTQSVCSITDYEEDDETNTVGSGTLSRTSSITSIEMEYVTETLSTTKDLDSLD